MFQLFLRKVWPDSFDLISSGQLLPEITKKKKRKQTKNPNNPHTKKNKPNQNTELQNIQHILVSRKRNLIVIRTTKKSLQCSKITITIQNSVLMEDKPGKLKTHTKEGHSYLH